MICQCMIDIESDTYVRRNVYCIRATTKHSTNRMPLDFSSCLTALLNINICAHTLIQKKLFYVQKRHTLKQKTVTTAHILPLLRLSMIMLYVKSLHGVQLADWVIPLRQSNRCHCIYIETIADMGSMGYHYTAILLNGTLLTVKITQQQFYFEIAFLQMNTRTSPLFSKIKTENKGVRLFSDICTFSS